MMSDSTFTETHSDNDLGVMTPQPSKLKKWLAGVAWSALVIFLLVFFTLLKIPQPKIKGYLQNTLTSTVRQQGGELDFKESRLRTGFGIRYELLDASLALPGSRTPLRFKKIGISPSFTSLLLGRLRGEVELESQGGYIQGSFSSTLPTRTASSSSGSSPQKFSTHWSSKNLDVGSLGLLAALTQLQGGLILNGDLSYSGESQQLNQAEGKVSLQLSKISLNEQSFMGFSLPKIQISDGVIQATLQKGRATLQEVRLGKMGGSDDLAAVVTGNIQMGPTFRQSNLNLTIAFSLSQNVLRSFGLLESLLSAGKQADGTYIYQLTGPVTSLVPAPVKNP